MDRVAVEPGSNASTTIVFSEALRFIAFCSRAWPTARVSEIVARLGLLHGAAPDPERRIPIERVFSLWAEVTRAVGDPSVPIRFAATRRPEDSGALGFAAMTAPTARAALQHVARYQRLLSDSGRWSLDEHGGDHVHVIWERPGPRSLGHRLANETVLAELVTGARQVLGALPLAGVAFRHAAPRDVRAHEEFFAAPIAWQADHDELVFERHALELRPLAHDPELAHAFVSRAEAELSAQNPASVVGRVRAEIEPALRNGDATSEAVARRLGLSERSLRRALAAEGTSFREVLEVARRERALELLQRSDFNATDAAFLLGFSESSAFSRAFRRWFGRSPSEARLAAPGARA